VNAAFVARHTEARGIVVKGNAAEGSKAWSSHNQNNYKQRGPPQNLRGISASSELIL